MSEVQFQFIFIYYTYLLCSGLSVSHRNKAIMISLLPTRYVYPLNLADTRIYDHNKTFINYLLHRTGNLSRQTEQRPHLTNPRDVIALINHKLLFGTLNIRNAMRLI